MRYGKKTTFIPQEDGSIKAVTESYDDQLSSVKEELTQNFKTTYKDFYKDIVKAIEPITQGKTTRLELTIKADKYKNPNSIVQTYLVYKEDFKRR